MREQRRPIVRLNLGIDCVQVGHRDAIVEIARPENVIVIVQLERVRLRLTGTIVVKKEEEVGGNKKCKEDKKRRDARDNAHSKGVN